MPIYVELGCSTPAASHISGDLLITHVPWLCENTLVNSTLVSFLIVLCSDALNEGTLSGIEPSLPAPAPVPSVTPNTGTTVSKAGLVLGGALPSIPADLLKKVKENSYIELTEFLPERIQDSVLYPDRKKRKVSPISVFQDWVLAFCTFSHGLLSSNPQLAAELLTFIGTVARLARDRPGQAWAAYERAMRAKITADPSISWGHIDQAAWALATVQPTSGPPQAAGFKRKAGTYCLKWNHSQCNYPNCKYTHACASCHNPGHRAPSCPSGPSKAKADM